MSDRLIKPERIYLQVDPDGESAIDWFDGVTWCEDRINDTDVEYIGFETFQEMNAHRHKMIVRALDAETRMADLESENAAKDKTIAALRARCEKLADEITAMRKKGAVLPISGVEIVRIDGDQNGEGLPDSFVLRRFGECRGYKTDWAADAKQKD